MGVDGSRVIFLFITSFKFNNVGITKKEVEEFLKSHNFPYQPNQHKICFPKLERIYERMAKDKVFPAIKIGNGKIIEGHHRYICSEMLGKELAVVKGGINLSQTETFVWTEIIVEDAEWDFDWEIRLHQRNFDQ